MFRSFFPNPKWFFISVGLWSALTIFCWYMFNTEMGSFLGFDMSEKEPVIGLGHFITERFQFFYLYYLIALGLLAAFWFRASPHRWQWWSILGSGFIIFITYYSVQVSVAINNWRRPFWDLATEAMSPNNPDRKPAAEYSELLFEGIVQFMEIALLAVVIFVFSRFFISHFIFRWRHAMNDYYTSLWGKLRHIEGASQRVQEDTMRFAAIMEGLGVAMVDAIMTLFAFLPVMWTLSEYVGELPFIGTIPYPLFTICFIWSFFGTGLLAIVGIKLPGLEFKNQRVEAAYRKELVFGEDDPQRAQPIELTKLFANVRKNYFRLYFHYMYFNVFRNLYFQTDNILVSFILVPTIAAGKITFGIMQQIMTAFGQVSSSFQYLVNSWPTIVELLSVYKRLASFEAAIKNEPLPDIDREFLAAENN